MFKVPVLVLLMAGTALCQEKPLLFNKADGDTLWDRAFKKAYSDKFTIKDVSVADDYVPPKPTAGGLPKDARDDEGNPLDGLVVVTYVVTADGLAKEPVVLSSSNEALSRLALSAMEDWRFTPGTVRGKPVATTAAQEFVFKAEKTGFETTNIVFYQPDEVLKKRLPGVGHLAAYIEKIQTATSEFLSKARKPATLQIAVAVRPGKTSHVWVEAPEMEPQTLDAMRKKLETIEPVEIQEGPVAFAICGTVAGGAASTENPPMPKEWKEASKKLPAPVVLPDDILNTVWPAE